MSMSYCVVKELKMVNFKLGETNAKMNYSACHERGTKMDENVSSISRGLRKKNVPVYYKDKKEVDHYLTLINTTSAASTATSVPVPIAIPT